MKEERAAEAMRVQALNQLSAEKGAQEALASQKRKAEEVAARVEAERVQTARVEAARAEAAEAAAAAKQQLDAKQAAEEAAAKEKAAREATIKASWHNQRVYGDVYECTIGGPGVSYRNSPSFDDKVMPHSLCRTVCVPLSVLHTQLISLVAQNLEITGPRLGQCVTTDPSVGPTKSHGGALFIKTTRGWLPLSDPSVSALLLECRWTD